MQLLHSNKLISDIPLAMVGGWFPELAVRSLILYHLQFRYIMNTCEQNASSGRIQNNPFNQLCSNCSNYLANHCTCITLVVHLHSLASVLVVLSLNQLQLICRYVDIDIAFPVAKSTYLVAYYTTSYQCTSYC